MMKIDKAPFTTTEERWIPQETQTIEGVVKAAVGDDIGLRLERYREFNYNHQDLFEVLSSKVGLLAVVLGGMVFFLMYMLFRGKKKSAEGRARKLSLEKLPQI